MNKEKSNLVPPLIDDEAPLCFQENKERDLKREEILKNILNALAWDKIDWKAVGLLLINEYPEIFWKMQLKVMEHERSLKWEL